MQSKKEESYSLLNINYVANGKYHLCNKVNLLLKHSWIYFISVLQTVDKRAKSTESNAPG